MTPTPHPPSIQGPLVTGGYADQGPIPELFLASGCFDTVVTRRYLWRYHDDTSESTGRLEGHSDNGRFPAKQRERLHDAIPRALERSGKGIKVSYAANLDLAKLAP